MNHWFSLFSIWACKCPAHSVDFQINILGIGDRSLFNLIFECGEVREVCLFFIIVKAYIVE